MYYIGLAIHEIMLSAIETVFILSSQLTYFFKFNFLASPSISLRVSGEIRYSYLVLYLIKKNSVFSPVSMMLYVGLPLF